jgi:7-carboxy-7-deazaguanine synthase
MKYPIAEIFSSLQGEGLYVGTKMLFVRTAGCTVGKPFTASEKVLLPVLPSNGHEKCTAWNGESFVCDTIYKTTEKLSVDEIISHLNGERIVCITGGEPLMHDLKPLIISLLNKNIRTHIETSGTIAIESLKEIGKNSVWVTVSPKINYLESSLEHCDEIKVLVDRQTFNKKDFEFRFGKYLHKIWLQPVNEILEINRDNLQFCINLIDTYTEARLSIQIHKWLEVR